MSYADEMRRVALDPDLSVSDAATALVRATILNLSVDPQSATPAEVSKLLESLADLIRAQNETGGDQDVLAQLLRGGRDAAEARARRAAERAEEQHADQSGLGALGEALEHDG